MTHDVLFFVLGITALTVGSDWLVRGASCLAERLGVSQLVIGLTMVAFGTSAPELFVSGAAALAGKPAVAVGNVMGSTVANVGLIVGLGALLRPITVHRRLLVRETPLVIIVLSSVMLLSLNDSLGRPDGVLLITCFSVYLLFLLKWGGGGLDELAREVEARQPTKAVAGAAGAAPDPAKRGGVEQACAFRRSRATFLGQLRVRRRTEWATGQLIIGLPLLLVGSNLLIDSALNLAEAFHVPDAAIAATMIAVGTSLPELASTIAAALRGMGDLAIGNVIGSNVFNLGLVLGTAAILRPLDVPPGLVVSQVLPALIFSAMLIPLALSKERVGRFEGALLLLAYIGFIYRIL